jgi:hypothetical protein
LPRQLEPDEAQSSGLQSLVEFSLQMPGNAVLFVVLLALALYVLAPYRPASR